MQPSQLPGALNAEYPPPLPLHIKKTRHRPSPTGSPRTMRADTDDGIRNSPGSPGLDHPLTVVKKRLSKNQALNSENLDSRSYHTQSNGRASSPNATYPRYGLRNHSDSSSLISSIESARQPSIDARLSSYDWKQDSDRGLVDLSHQPTESISCSSRQTSYSLSSAPSSDDTGLDPYVLVPNISITPAARSVDDGQSTMWVAIEISGQLFRPSGPDDGYGTPGINNLFMPVHHSGAGLSRYGYLYDLKVDILPTADSSITSIIDDSTAKTIQPGSSILILACVQLEASQPHPVGVKRKYEPDDLFADLEFQLGSVKTEYIQVCLSYCHSGFPMLADMSVMSGVSSNHTRLVTTTTAVISRQGSSSVWSPGPTPSANALFPIIAAHWGPVRAHEIMSKIAPLRASPRRIAKGNSKSMANLVRGDDTPKRPDTGMGMKVPPVQVPRRQASLGKQLMAPYHHLEEMDPARKIWMKMRRVSSGRRDLPSLHVNKVRRVPAKSSDPDPTVSSENTPPGSSRSRDEVERKRQQIKDMALRNKRSIGADSLRSLVPSLANFHLGGDGESAHGDTAEQQETHLAEKKNDGRWNFNAWW